MPFTNLLMSLFLLQVCKCIIRISDLTDSKLSSISIKKCKLLVQVCDYIILLIPNCFNLSEKICCGYNVPSQTTFLKESTNVKKRVAYIFLPIHSIYHLLTFWCRTLWETESSREAKNHPITIVLHIPMLCNH